MRAPDEQNPLARETDGQTTAPADGVVVNADFDTQYYVRGYLAAVP
jgi:hypothetical protein